MADNDVTSEGCRLIEAWMGATKALDRACSEVNSREADVRNTRNALAKWLLPEDAKVGEKIAVWHVDSLIQVEVTDRHPLITIRKRGRGR